MHLLHKEFLYTLRSSSRSPIFAAAFILAIAVGIGSAVSVFTVMDALLLRPLPVPHPEQLVQLTGIYRTLSLTPLSYPMYAEMERDQRAFSQICGWSVGSDFYVEINGTGSLANVRSVTGSYYSVLGTRPLLGRLIKPSDMQVTARLPSSVMRLWQKRFGGDASVVGRSIRIRTILFTIIGCHAPMVHRLRPRHSPQITIPIGAAGMYDRQGACSGYRHGPPLSRRVPRPCSIASQIRLPGFAGSHPPHAERRRAASILPLHGRPAQLRRAWS
jgi:hypothetical protein